MNEHQVLQPVSSGLFLCFKNIFEFFFQINVFFYIFSGHFDALKSKINFKK
jgi:hypothetical protein